MRSVVIKVGGSLLSLPDLRTRLRAMFVAINADRFIVIAGGGPAANLVRDWDTIHQLDEETAHWLAIDSMTLTGLLLNGILPEAVFTARRRLSLDDERSGQIVILEPRAILNEILAETGEQPPVGWDCTSDSIAGWIAVHWPAAAIVLAKSVDTPADLDAAIGSEAIDACFESIVFDRLPVYWCNVRSDPEVVTLWKDVSSTGCQPS